MYNITSSAPNIKNCILWNDMAASGTPEIYNSSSTPTVSYSDIKMLSPGSVYAGTGNINSDPKFIDPAMANYHLQPTSPCINTGDPSPTYNDSDGSRNDMGAYGGQNAKFDSDYDGMENYWEDLYGLNKNDPSDAALDPDDDGWTNLHEFEMGTDPLVSNACYVDIDRPGGGDGLSWVTAFNNIQTAVNSISGVAIFWIAEGTYASGTTNPVLTMKEYVELYGGFAGTETQFSQRNITLHPTTLDGQNVSYHVVVGASSARIDGFTIKHGNANDSFPNYNGGGMYNSGKTNLVIANCTFSGNSSNYGGGISNYSSSPTITNCTFSGNSVTGTGYGGGIYNTSSSSPTITNCTFTGNSAYYDGGGIYNSSSSPTITNCTFSGNSAQYGGGIYNYSSSPTITNCTFSGNSSNYGGGIYNDTSSPAIKNCILWNDLAASGTPEIYNSSSTPIVSYSDIKMSPSSVYTGTGNINSNPLFLHVPIFWDRTKARGTTTTIIVANAAIYFVNDVIEILNDGIARTVTSASGTTVYFTPALSSSSQQYWPVGNWGPGATDLTENLRIPTGSPCKDTATSVGAPANDLDNYPRPYPVGGAFDMGAYEYHP